MNVLSGDVDEQRVGETVVLQPAHPLMAAVPLLGRMKVAPATMRLVATDAPSRFALEVEHGKTRMLEETVLTDSPDGGTTVVQRISGHFPATVTDSMRAQTRFLTDQARADLAFIDDLAAAPSTIVVAGASGLIGTQVCALLRMAGHRVVTLVRDRVTRPDEALWNPTNVTSRAR